MLRPPRPAGAGWPAVGGVCWGVAGGAGWGSAFRSVTGIRRRRRGPRRTCHVETTASCRSRLASRWGRLLGRGRRRSLGKRVQGCAEYSANNQYRFPHSFNRISRNITRRGGQVLIWGKCFGFHGFYTVRNGVNTWADAERLAARIRAVSYDPYSAIYETDCSG